MKQTASNCGIFRPNRPEQTLKKTAAEDKDSVKLRGSPTTTSVLSLKPLKSDMRILRRLPATLAATAAQFGRMVEYTVALRLVSTMQKRRQCPGVMRCRDVSMEIS
jgi:hypothetical protein